MTQVQRERATQTSTADETPVEPKPQERAAKLSAETEELLADIDDLLSEVDQDLAETFVQQGGE